MSPYKNSQSRIYLCIVLLVLFHISVLSAPAVAASINPTDARGIRKQDWWGLSLLGFLAINNQHTSTYWAEDRTVLEFDVSSLSGTPLELVTLDLGMENGWPGPPDGIIDVFTFTGDGIVTADEFFAGGPAPFMSVVVGDVDGIVKFDVTSAVQTAVMAGDRFIGFRLSTETLDNYFLGGIVQLPEPVLTVVPEPVTLLLLGLGGILLRRKIKH
jgi:hypothetical protein